MNLDRVRSRLVLWLSRTQAASRELSPEQHRAYCEKLGITEELLREAHMLRAKVEYRQHAATGRHGDYLARKVFSQEGRASVVAHCSKDLKKHIESYCARRQVKHTTLARSLVHHYLRGTWEPEQVTGRWEIWDFHGEKGAVKEANIHAAVSLAAKEAFRLRSKHFGVTPVKMIRALICATMNGQFAQPGTIRYVTTGQMYSNIERYVLPSS